MLNISQIKSGYRQKEKLYYDLTGNNPQADFKSFFAFCQYLEMAEVNKKLQALDETLEKLKDEYISKQ